MRDVFDPESAFDRALVAEEIVFCKDCVWFKLDRSFDGRLCAPEGYVCLQHDMHVMKSDYCSFGRKRE